jgi:hypothetical protein
MELPNLHDEALCFEGVTLAISSDRTGFGPFCPDSIATASVPRHEGLLAQASTYSTLLSRKEHGPEWMASITPP